MSTCLVLALISPSPGTRPANASTEQTAKFPVVHGRVLHAGVPVATTVEIVAVEEPTAKYQETEVDYGGQGYRFVVHPRRTYRVRYEAFGRWLWSEPVALNEGDVELDLVVPTNGSRLIAFQWGDERAATFIASLQVGGSTEGVFAPARFSYAFDILWVEIPASLSGDRLKDWIVRGEIFEPFAREFELRGRVGTQTVLPRGAIPIPEGVESGRDGLSLRPRFPDGPYFSLTVEIGEEPWENTSIHRVSEDVRPGWYTPIQWPDLGLSPFSFYSGPPEEIPVFDASPASTSLLARVERIASPRLVDGVVFVPELPAGRYALLLGSRDYSQVESTYPNDGFRFVFQLDRDRVIAEQTPGEGRIHVRVAKGNMLGVSGFRDGDLITHIDGTPARFSDPEYARRSLIALGTRERVRVTIERGPRTLDLSVDPVKAFLEASEWPGRLELHAE